MWRLFLNKCELIFSDWAVDKPEIMLTDYGQRQSLTPQMHHCAIPAILNSPISFTCKLPLTRRGRRGELCTCTARHPRAAITKPKQN